MGIIEFPHTSLQLVEFIKKIEHKKHTNNPKELGFGDQNDPQKE